MATVPPHPPRLSGSSQTDVVAMVNYLHDFYQAAVIEQYFAQQADLENNSESVAALEDLNLGIVIHSAIGSTWLARSIAVGSNKLAVTNANGVAGNPTLDVTEANLVIANMSGFDTDGTLAANSDTRVASQKAVKTYVATAVTGLLDFKGATDCSGNPDYPIGVKGDAYVVSVSGKTGGAAGKSVDVGDVYVASADNAGGDEAAVGTSWFVLEHNLVGALLSANNLSDIANAATARGNLGLGSMALASKVGSAYTITNTTTSRTLNADTATPTVGAVYSQTEMQDVRDRMLALEDVVATLIQDLKTATVVA